jgi:integrase
MPSLKLTALAVENAKVPSHGRAEYWDLTLPGLGLRVTYGGAKSWTVLYRIRGRLRRATLGRYPALSLAAARDKARELFKVVEKGTDPGEVKAEERRRDADRFEMVVAEFIERHAKPNNRGWKRQEDDLRREFVPHWKNRAIADIRRRDILDRLDQIADRTSPRRANRYLALLKKFFAWCVERGHLDASPAAAIKPPGKEVSRDRVLSRDELRLVWKCCETDGWPFGDLFRLLILTAQRLGEVATMRWRDVDLEKGIWTVPAEIAKNGVANEVPLAAAATAILKALPSAGRDGYLFPALNGSGNPVSGFSRAKSRLDKMIADEIAETGDGAEPAPWRLHDLRRTAASGMAELRIAPHVIERVLNHVSGSRAGVAGVYNRFGYLPEKRHALKTWAEHVERLVSAQPSAKVVALDRARGRRP